MDLMVAKRVLLVQYMGGFVNLLVISDFGETTTYMYLPAVHTCHILSDLVVNSLPVCNSKVSSLYYGFKLCIGMKEMFIVLKSQVSHVSLFSITGRQPILRVPVVLLLPVVCGWVLLLRLCHSTYIHRVHRHHHLLHQTGTGGGGCGYRLPVPTCAVIASTVYRKPGLDALPGRAGVDQLVSGSSRLSPSLAGHFIGQPASTALRVWVLSSATLGSLAHS